VTVRWIRGFGAAMAVVVAIMVAIVVAATGFAGSAQAAAPPAPGIQVKDQSLKCTAGFAAQGDDGSYYLFTSGHCNHPEGSLWTYAQDVPLGRITASEQQADRQDVAIIRLDPGVGVPASDIGGMPVRDMLDTNQIQVGTPFCKLGAITGETCGAVTSTDGEMLVASVSAKPGDSGSAGYVKNADGTVSAVGVLSGSLNDDLRTTVYVLLQPLLGRWGLRLLP
jgi:hypothetical protein